MTISLFKLIIEITISLIGCLVFILLLAAIGRRILHGKRYRELDVLRAVFKSRLIQLMKASELDQALSEFS